MFWYALKHDGSNYLFLRTNKKQFTAIWSKTSCKDELDITVYNFDYELFSTVSSWQKWLAHSSCKKDFGIIRIEHFKPRITTLSSKI